MKTRDTGKEFSPYLILLVVSLGMVMSILDSTIVNVAIAKLQVVFGENITSIQWVITAYLLTFSVSLCAAGWLADNLGYKKSFMLALALFTLGSFLCSLSSSLPVLVVSRIVQGIGGGLLSPIGMAFIARAFPKERLGMVMALFSIPNISASSFGPSLGGWIIDHFSWQVMFDINIPLGILGLVLASIILKEHKNAVQTPLDIPCFLSLAAAMALLLYGLANGNAAWNTDGWTSNIMVAVFSLSLTGFGLFLIFQRTTDNPLIDFSLFRIRNFTLDTLVLFMFGLGVFGSDFLLPLYLQEGLGYTPTQAGAVFIPFGFAMIGASLVSGQLTDKVDLKVPGFIGIFLRAYGMFRLTSLTPYSNHFQIALDVTSLGAGMGFLTAPIQTAAVFDIPPKKIAQASGIIQMLRQLGGSFGVAVLSTILVGREKFQISAIGQAAAPLSIGFRNASAQLLSRVLWNRPGSAGGPGSMVRSIVVSQVATSAFVRAIDDVYFVTMIISIISSIPFFFLSTSKNRPRKDA